MKGFDYEKYKDQKIQKALKQKMDDKIFLKKERAKVNQKFYDQQKSKNSEGANDPRFTKMFKDDDFKIDKDKKSQ